MPIRRLRRRGWCSRHYSAAGGRTSRKPGRRVPLLRTGDVEAHDAVIAVAQSKIGDVARVGSRSRIAVTSWRTTMSDPRRAQASGCLRPSHRVPPRSPALREPGSEVLLAVPTGPHLDHPIGRQILPRIRGRRDAAGWPSASPRWCARTSPGTETRGRSRWPRQTTGRLVRIRGGEPVSGLLPGAPPPCWAADRHQDDRCNDTFGNARSCSRSTPLTPPRRSSHPDRRHRMLSGSMCDIGRIPLSVYQAVRPAMLPQQRRHRPQGISTAPPPLTHTRAMSRHPRSGAASTTLHSRTRDNPYEVFSTLHSKRPTRPRSRPRRPPESQSTLRMPEDHLACSCVKCDPVDPVRAPGELYFRLDVLVRRCPCPANQTGDGNDCRDVGEINSNFLDIAVFWFAVAMPLCLPPDGEEWAVSPLGAPSA